MAKSSSYCVIPYDIFPPLGGAINNQAMMKRTFHRDTLEAKRMV